jgi:hypothetical protein
MNREEETATTQTSQRPYTVRLPGFISDEEVGLGDVVKRATYAVGIKPCGGCNRRRRSRVGRNSFRTWKPCQEARNDPAKFHRGRVALSYERALQACDMRD